MYNCIVKRKDLEKALKNAGFVFVRHGGKDDVVKRGKDEEQLQRHKEINENLAKAIMKKWGL